jgi:hypothetical protein
MYFSPSTYEFRAINPLKDARPRSVETSKRLSIAYKNNNFVERKDTNNDHC